VLAAALIGGGFSTIVAVVASVVTYKVAKLSSFTGEARLRHEAQLEETRQASDVGSPGCLHGVAQQAGNGHGRRHP